MLSIRVTRRSLRSAISTSTTLRSSRTTLSRPTRLNTSRSIPQAVSRWYTTEKVLQHRLKKSIATAEAASSRLPATLYDATQERENCGVGMVASLKSVASRNVVMDANEMLVRMSHRGGVGCCPASGDGAGK